ncbi:hypothetical protein RDI58_024795 [Solanum bulbocastanum]|uniref:Mutator-like transposase n=1 Tax=Solanum bulbocastanum TaxID=147425 RepID=A0AAN8Y3S5_SOLBU
MVELCGYLNDSIIFWHKCEKLGNKWRLVSTEVEAHSIKKFIPRDRVVELYFEHLDSYIGIDDPIGLGCRTSHIPENEDVVGPVDKEFERENLSSEDDFEDSENKFSNDEAMVDSQGHYKHSFEDDRELITYEIQKKMLHEDGDPDCVNSEDNKSLDGDSDNESFDFPKHNAKTDGKNPILALEYTFESKEEFKNVVTTHEVSQGRYIQWKKNDKVRMKAKCIHNDCSWVIMASRMHREKTFQVKTYNPSHSCKNWHHYNKTITSSFIARTYLDRIKHNRGWKMSEFRDTVSVELKAHVTFTQARMAMKKAIALLDGSLKDQFAILWDYVHEIDKTNPGTSIYMKFTNNEMPNMPYRFQRVYLCFAACKEAFKVGCRRIVGVDGCWLKGPMYGNQLLTAVGLDANNNIFPVAYAVVERETKETWSWFLTHLASDLEIDDQESWTFMSDKQKGLVEAFNEILPYVDHRFCVRHLHNNFKKAGFFGLSLKNALWAAANATTVEFFKICMEKMHELDAEAAAWLNEKPPTEWSKSHFSTGAKCDVLLNNMCECFNSMILDARDKPIITLLEKLRYLLMARFQANREKAERWNSGDICPRIKSILHKNESAAAAFIPKKSNQWHYEILGASIADNWAVDLQNRKCSCRKWTITGIPCNISHLG